LVPRPPDPENPPCPSVPRRGIHHKDHPTCSAPARLDTAFMKISRGYLGVSPSEDELGIGDRGSVHVTQSEAVHVLRWSAGMGWEWAGGCSFELECCAYKREKGHVNVNLWWLNRFVWGDDVGAQVVLCQVRGLRGLRGLCPSGAASEKTASPNGSGSGDGHGDGDGNGDGGWGNRD